MNVVIPMAGTDRGFQEQGYPYGKSLIEIRGRPLIEHVWEPLSRIPGARFLFVVRKEESVTFHLPRVLALMAPDCQIVRAEGPTAGAACSVLLAAEHIDNEDELVIANGDQIIRADLSTVLDEFRSRGLDAGTIVFDSIHPRWSFVRLDEHRLVVEAAEKRPISRFATAGFYYFRHGADFVAGAMSMILKDADVNGQFYTCPVFNELLLRQKRIGVFRIRFEDYISLATPQGVEHYEQLLNRMEGTPRDANGKT